MGAMSPSSLLIPTNICQSWFIERKEVQLALSVSNSSLLVSNQLHLVTRTSSRDYYRYFTVTLTGLAPSFVDQILVSMEELGDALSPYICKMSDVRRTLSSWQIPIQQGGSVRVCIFVVFMPSFQLHLLLTKQRKLPIEWTDSYTPA